jgi:hypothetical protein
MFDAYQHQEFSMDGYSSNEETDIPATPAGRMAELRQKTNDMIGKTPKRKRAEEDLGAAIKRLKSFTEDHYGVGLMARRIDAFIETEKEKIRAAYGDKICWQDNDDEADRRALLDDNITLIMQARRAILSRDNEGVSIQIEQNGWEDPETRIRPKYSIVIGRIKNP